MRASVDRAVHPLILSQIVTRSARNNGRHGAIFFHRAPRSLYQDLTEMALLPNLLKNTHPVFATDLSTLFTLSRICPNGV